MRSTLEAGKRRGAGVGAAAAGAAAGALGEGPHVGGGGWERIPRPSRAGLFAVRWASDAERQKDGEGGAAYPEAGVVEIRGGPSTCGVALPGLGRSRQCYLGCMSGCRTVLERTDFAINWERDRLGSLDAWACVWRVHNCETEV